MLMKELARKIRRENLSPHSNFSFTVSDDELWADASVNNSLFNGAIFQGCIFRNICFDHSDLEGTRFLGCQFINCTMVGTETHSIWMANCDFENVNFSQSSILDSNWHISKFLGCSFDGVVQSNSIFDGCLFDPFMPNHGSFSLNRYIKTTFCNAVFRNVFYYHIFEQCIFKASSFEAYLLGYVYGLTKENLTSLSGMLMGEKSSTPLTELYNQIEQIYSDRKMYFNIGFLRLGVPTCNIEEILLNCTGILKKLLQEDQLLKTEQLQFLGRLIEYLKARTQVAPITVLLLEQGIRDIIKQFNVDSNTAWEKARSEIHSLHSQLYFACLEDLDRIYTQSLPEILDELITLKITYRQKPELPLAILLSEMAPDIDPKPKQIKTAEGSWIEWISSPDGIMNCVQLFVSLLGSIAIPIMIDCRNERRRKKKVAQSNTNGKTKLAIQSEVEISLPAPYATSVGTVTIKGYTGSVIRVIMQHQILASKSKKGYGAENICRIEILPAANGHPSME